MGLFFFKKDKEEEKNRNLDFLTPQEKSAVNMAFEMAERLTAGQPESERKALAEAKRHYLIDMGVEQGEAGYTAADLKCIALWVGFTRQMLAETALPGTAGQLQLLTQVQQKLAGGGLSGAPGGNGFTAEGGNTPHRDLSFLLPAEKNVTRLSLNLVIDTQYAEGRHLAACQSARAHLQADSGYTREDFYYMKWALGVFADTLKSRLKTESGETAQKYQTNLNLAASALKKLES